MVEFLLCFQNHFVGVLTCSTAIILHALALRSIMVSAFSIVTGQSLYALSHDPVYFWMTMTSTLLLHSIFFLLLMRILPARYLRVINQSRDFSVFLCILSCLFIAFIIYNSTVYSIDESAPDCAPHRDALRAVCRPCDDDQNGALARL